MYECGEKCQGQACGVVGYDHAESKGYKELTPEGELIAINI